MTGMKTASYQKKGSRKELQKDAIFGPAFIAAKARIGNMDVRFIQEEHPLRQALPEMYVSIAIPPDTTASRITESGGGGRTIRQNHPPTLTRPGDIAGFCTKPGTWPVSAETGHVHQARDMAGFGRNRPCPRRTLLLRQAL